MKILVTGHCGWIGSHFTQLLDSYSIAWTGIDSKEGEYLSLDMGVFLDKVQDCDIVVHLAATPRIPASWEYPDHYRINNVDVTDMVARICAEQGKYLVFASSSSVYGNGGGPLNPYSWTKLAGEESIKMYGRSLDLRYTIARIFTNYGGNNPGTLVISKWLDNYKEGIPLVLRGDGTQTRDFIHVEDTAQALLAICQQQPKQQQLDIGTGDPVSLRELLELFDCAYIREPELIGYADHTCANLQHTQTILDWAPVTSIKTWVQNQLIDISGKSCYNNTMLNTIES
jgi:UDP-glucose 4-epimerase